MRRVEVTAPGEVRVLAQFHGIKIPVILDTGSPVSLIREALVNQLGEQCEWIQSQSREDLKAANGTPVRALGRVQLELEIGGKAMWHTFIVVEDMLDSALVGLDVLHKLGALIDCQKEELIMDGVRVPWTRVSGFQSPLSVQEGLRRSTAPVSTVSAWSDPCCLSLLKWRGSRSHLRSTCLMRECPCG